MAKSNCNCLGNCCNWALSSKKYIKTKFWKCSTYWKKVQTNILINTAQSIGFFFLQVGEYTLFFYMPLIEFPSGKCNSVIHAAKMLSFLAICYLLITENQFFIGKYFSKFVYVVLKRSNKRNFFNTLVSCSTRVDD